MNPKTEQLVDRLAEATVHTLELYGIYLGRRLGLYETLRDHGPLTEGELASRSGIAVRYAREWLEQQAVAGFLEVALETHAHETRCFRLPEAHARVLADEADPAHVSPFAELVVGIAGVLPDVVDAYQAGGGVAYERYGHDFCHGQAGINRPAFEHDLPNVWLPAVPELCERLAGPEARIADLGCGAGWSTIGLGRAFQGADVVGIDLDTTSVAAAQENAHDSGVPVRFLQRSAVQLADEGPFDAVFIFEALHDMSQPAEVLRAAREALSPEGRVIIADERVEEVFSAPGSLTERMMYGWSISHCLPVSMSEQPSEAIGTVMRSSTLREIASRAGYSSVSVLDIDNDLFRFYELAA